MADDNLAITKIGQQASQNFFNSFDRNIKSLVDSSMAADRAKMNAAGTIANFTLSKAATDQNIRGSESRIRLAEAANDRSQALHDIQYSEEAIDQKKRINELTLKNLELDYEKSLSDRKDAEIDKYFNNALGPIMEDMNQLYINSYNRKFANDSQKLVSEIKSKAMSGELEPSEAAKLLEKRYYSLRGSADFSVADVWTNADRIRVGKFDPKLASRLDYQLNPDTAGERNGVAASFVGGFGADGEARYAKWLDQNPWDAQDISRYRADIRNIDSFSESIKNSIKANNEIASESRPDVQAKMDAKNVQLTNQFIALQERRSEIVENVADGLGYGETRIEDRFDPMGIPSPGTDVNDENSPENIAAEEAIKNAKNDDNTLVNTESEKHQQLKSDFGSTLSEMTTGLKFSGKKGDDLSKFINMDLMGISGHELDAWGSIPMFSGRVGRLDPEAADKIDANVQLAMSEMSTEQVNDLIRNNPDAFPGIKLSRGTIKEVDAPFGKFHDNRVGLNKITENVVNRYVEYEIKKLLFDKLK